jgi:nucleotide-binding universal stress UspA family protein
MRHSPLRGLLLNDSTVPPRVLLASDCSEAAWLATQVAAHIAAGQDAELILVHVTAATDHRVARMAPAMPLTRRLDDPLSTPVLADARTLAFQEGASSVAVLLSGDPAGGILAWARGAQPELVVLGSRRHFALPVNGAGTARRVQARATCPVLVVTPRRTTASRAWAGRCCAPWSGMPAGRTARLPAPAAPRAAAGAAVPHPWPPHERMTSARRPPASAHARVRRRCAERGLASHPRTRRRP